MSALPPVVVSGLPNMMPIFMRIWLMKITMHLDLEMDAVSLRSALLMRRACMPGCMSPISPSSSALGVSAATEFDHQHVHGAGAHQRVGDLQRLLAVVGLRDQQVLDLDAELPGVDGIERVLGIDEGADAALLLRLGQDLESQRGLAGRLRPVDLDDAAARQAADAEGDVEAERACRQRLDLDALVGAEPHDRALAVHLLDLGERGLERLLLVHATPFDDTQLRLFHGLAPYFTSCGWRQNATLDVHNVHFLFSSRNAQLGNHDAVKATPYERA